MKERPDPGEPDPRGPHLRGEVVVTEKDGSLSVDWDKDPIPDPPAEILEDAESDEAASAEARSLQEGTLEDRAAKSQHERDENLKDDIAWMLRWALRFAFGIIIAIAAIWCWHLLLPESYAFLTPDQINKIENIGFGGIAVALMNVARKNLPGSSD